MEKTALITGASRGLGRAMALELCRDYHIVAVGKTTGALEELDDEIQALGGQMTLAPMDITVDAAMQKLCHSIYERWGQLDLWVHTAIHAAPLSPVSHTSEKDFEKSLQVNVSATSRLIRYVEPLLGRAGQAIFFDDTRSGQPFFGSYGASKAAQVSLVRSWQAETQKTGPNVRLFQPNAMATAMRARFFPGEDHSKLTAVSSEAARLVTEISK